MNGLAAGSYSGAERTQGCGKEAVAEEEKEELATSLLLEIIF